MQEVRQRVIGLAGGIEFVADIQVAADHRDVREIGLLIVQPGERVGFAGFAAFTTLSAFAALAPVAAMRGLGDLDPMLAVDGVIRIGSLRQGRPDAAGQHIGTQPHPDLYLRTSHRPHHVSVIRECELFAIKSHHKTLGLAWQS